MIQGQEDYLQREIYMYMSHICTVCMFILYNSFAHLKFISVN